MPGIEPRPLPPREKSDWLRLTRCENVGPITFRRLLERFVSAAAAIEALPELAQRGGRTRSISLCSKAAAEQEIEAVGKLDGRLIALCEPDYPAHLAALDDAPPVLTVLGHAHLLRKPALAIVGARNASANGRKFARAISGDLGRHGFVIVSGLARGIDGAAHEGALETGTVAVNAGGADIVYPEENRRLYERILDAGVILSEEPLGTTPQARHFPRRNRLISGLSLGVLVVEAAARSGSLITARLAGEQGREVLAVPGSPLDPRYRGTNDLIREGAVLTESAADVVAALQGQLREPAMEAEAPSFLAASPAAPGLPPDDARMTQARSEIGTLIGVSPVTVDEIVRQCQLSPAVVSTTLLEMELAGRISRHPGGQISAEPNEIN